MVDGGRRWGGGGGEGGLNLKIEGVLIICIIVVLAKTCFEKFAPKVRRWFNNFLPAKTLVRHISQTITRIEKNFF